MKSFSVKSNAKRFAKGLADKFPGIEAIEPVETEVGAKEWFAAVRVVDHSIDKAALHASVAESAVIHGLDLGGEPVNEAGAVGEDVTDIPAFLRKDTEDRAKRTAEAAKHLPPPVVSTPEEVEARREAKRTARQQAKNEGGQNVEGARKARTGAVAEKAFAMLRRSGGVTAGEMQEALGWQPHTLRGWISTQNSKGAGITKVKDSITKVTVWRIVGAEAAA